MTSWMLSLVESSLLLAVFYMVYLFGLRRESFFQLTRWYLLIAVASSCLIPHIDVSIFSVHPATPAVVEAREFRQDYTEAWDQWWFDSQLDRTIAIDRITQRSNRASEGSLWPLFAVYLAGVAFLLGRTLWLVYKLMRLVRHSKKQRIGDLVVVRTGVNVPFSFWKYVFVPEKMESDSELDQVLAHERIHVDQRHTLDLLFVQFIAAFTWFNPIIWRLLKSLKATHEYITDRKILNEGYSLESYQTILLSQVISNNSYGLVHNFNLSFIKKRITMMSTKSGPAGIIKATASIVVAVATSMFIVQCNARFDEQALNVPVKTDIELTPAVLPSSHADAFVEAKQSFTLTIVNNQLIVNGQVTQITELENLVKEAGLTRRAAIVMDVDKDQKMGFVRQVQYELRRLDLRKVLYSSQSTSGQPKGMAMLLPPLPEDWETVHGSPAPDLEQLEKEGVYSIMRVRLGDNEKRHLQARVHEFVTWNVQQGKKYVVSAKVTVDDTYQVYVENLSYIHAGFNQYYQERADKLYGNVNFLELDREVPADEEKYQAIRKGVPRSISIAED